jgi:retron-type reverse transcriptase
VVCSREQPGGVSRLGGDVVGKSGTADKSFVISKQLVWEAYKRVKANKGAPGVDEQSIAAFETDLKDNLYKIWSASSRAGGVAMRFG